MSLTLMYKGEELSGKLGNDASDIYSTEETRIGTWIDGKPLYRNQFSFSAKPVSQTWNLILTEARDYVETFTGYTGLFKINGFENLQLCIPFIQAKSSSILQEIDVLFNSNNKTFYMYGRWESPITISGTIFFEYTKTTD